MEETVLARRKIWLFRFKRRSPRWRYAPDQPPAPDLSATRRSPRILLIRKPLHRQGERASSLSRRQRDDVPNPHHLIFRRRERREEPWGARGERLWDGLLPAVLHHKGLKERRTFFRGERAQEGLGRGGLLNHAKTLTTDPGQSGIDTMVIDPRRLQHAVRRRGADRVRLLRRGASEQAGCLLRHELRRPTSRGSGRLDRGRAARGCVWCCRGSGSSARSAWRC